MRSYKLQIQAISYGTTATAPRQPGTCTLEPARSRRNNTTGPRISEHIDATLYLRQRRRDSVATEGAHGRKRRLTLAVASGSPAAIQCVLARDQKHGEVLRTAQGAVPFVRLLDEDSDVGAGASEDGVT